MTKETKIGLLVGLAFIIIVGILLGDSVRHATDVQPASLPLVGPNVRVAITTPGTPVSPPISMQGQGTAPNAVPQQTVLTNEEVSRPQGGGVVIIGPGNVNPNFPPTNTNPGPRSAEGNGLDVNRRSGPVNPNSSNHNGDSLNQFAQQHGEELVPLGTRPGNADTGNTPRPTKPNNTLAMAKTVQNYQAGTGDSLGRIASKFYGSSAKPLRDAIVAANPSLKQNPDRILAGQTYTIPALETATATPTPNPAPATPLPASRGGTGTTNPPEYWYTVKENDNLWRIARDQVGDPAAVSALKELNKEAFKGGETVRINMKLRLPAKPVASVN